MLAIYDLAVSPPTYDFVGFLVSAERARLEKKEKDIKVLIVWGSDNGFRKDDLPPRNPEDRRKMLENIVLPMCQLLPSVISVQTVERENVILEGVVFPETYTIFNPVSHYGLQFIAQNGLDGLYPLRVDEPAKDHNLVTITLREADYWPSRNSSLGDWVEVARALKAQGKRVVFVRDTSKADEIIEGFESSSKASSDLIARIKLYASASLNLMTNNGPAWVAAFCPQVNLMMFKIFAENAPCVDEGFYARCGFPKGSQFKRAGMRIVYADDKSETILKEIESGIPKKPMLAYRGSGNVENSVVIENMRVNCARDLPWLIPGNKNQSQCVIVGGGPSLLQSISALRDRKKRGQTIFALNNAWRVLPFIPQFIVCMDSRAENAAFFKDCPEGSTYLIASSCHPDVFQALKDRNVIVWHAHQGLPGQEDTVIEFANGRYPALLGGGGTVGIRSMVICYTLGFRKLHLYGMDSSYSGHQHHAYDQSLNDAEKVIDITPEGMSRTYYCAPWMARQADEFQKFYRMLSDKGCFIQAHGSGLLPDLCRFINERQRKSA